MINRYVVVFAWHSRILHSSEYPGSKSFVFDAETDEEAVQIAQDYKDYCRINFPNESYQLLSLHIVNSGIQSRSIILSDTYRKVRRLPVPQWSGPSMKQIMPDESILELLAYQESTLF